MTPSEYEWMCEQIELEADRVIKANADKAKQVRENRPENAGWFFGQVAKNLNYDGDFQLIREICCERLGLNTAPPQTP